ncbi:MAG: GNAT family N-acetyltransferase [Oscillospiraceae bacterium]|nr:GNAT family N-acetyltransferase [Oscillospiraceae bacterium]
MKITFRNATSSDFFAMKSLWESTFKDPLDYVEMLFDNYILENNCIVAYDGSDLVANLIGIPYNFKYRDLNFNALYLCGLATESLYRGKGIMGHMLEDITKKFSSENIDFLFLIPADTHLRDYYSRFGYYDTEQMKRLSYVCANKFQTIVSEIKILDKNLPLNVNGNQYVIFENYLDISASLLKDIIDKCMREEAKDDTIHIYHTELDWKLIIRDKLSSERYLTVNITNLEDIFFIDPIKSEIEVVAGDDKHIDEIINSISVLYIGSADHSNGVIPSNKDNSRRLRVRKEKYGMVKFNPKFLNKIAHYFKGSENPIFQEVNENLKKYEKMNFQERHRIYSKIFARHIYFRFMLD